MCSRNVIGKVPIDAHGGTVDVISNHSDGTRFTIRLPKLPPTAAEGAEHMAQA